MESKKTAAGTSTLVLGDANRDPISGAPGAHPVGVGTGAVGGGAAGAVIGGVVAGPVGAAIGAVAGAVAGGLAGKEAAEVVNPTVEHAYWRNEFGNRPYFTLGSPYEQFGPAYQYGWESHAKFSTNGKSFNEVESELKLDWDNRRGESRLTWENAKNASRDAWQRVEDAVGRASRSPKRKS